MSIGDIIRRAAQEAARGNKIGVVFEDTKLTFREVDELSNKLANSLIHLGPKKGNRVGALEQEQ